MVENAGSARGEEASPAPAWATFFFQPETGMGYLWGLVDGYIFFLIVLDNLDSFPENTVTLGCRRPWGGW
jgi:hypothetical protein